MPWLSVRLEIDCANAGPLSDALLSAGAESVFLSQGDCELSEVQALLRAGADPQALVREAAAAARLGAVPAFHVSALNEQDWVRQSQEQFAPFTVGERLWIGASWHEPPAHAGALVRIDPGLAFGTGSHASTRLALHFLEKKIRCGERVLDYGCGSGILAIAAAKLGAAQTDAVDVDPQALETTAANARANSVRVRAMLPEALVPQEYDIVVANILAKPLIVLAPLLARLTKSGGWLALSGILNSQAAEVARAYAEAFETQPPRIEEGWALIEATRR